MMDEQLVAKENIFGDDFNYEEQEEEDDNFEIHIVKFLDMKEQDYKIDTNYFQTKQPYIQWHMRAMLVDWMMEVSDEICLKR